MLFADSFDLIGLARKIPKDVKLKPDDLPSNGVSNDIGNFVVKFDEHWRQEPKDNPNI